MLEETEVQVFSRLRKVMTADGFELLWEKKQFRKTTETGFQNVSISISQYTDDFVMEVSLGTRSNLVESLVGQFLNYSPSFLADSHTAIASMGKLLGRPYERFVVKTPQAFEAACTRIETFMHEQGFTFLTHYTNLHNLHEAYNTHPTQNCLLAYNTTHRCFRGITIARLIESPQWAALATNYQKVLQAYGVPTSVKESFHKLIRYLEYLHPN
ncbi:MAG: hypothetical protein ACFB0B_22360 [Thermonemataceae bacterium]